MPAGLQEGRAVTDQNRGNATPLASYCDPLLSTHRGTRPSRTFGVKTMWIFFARYEGLRVLSSFNIQETITLVRSFVGSNSVEGLTLQ